MNKHKGVLDSYTAKGSQGVLWILREDGKEGGDAIIFLEPGDELLVYKDDGSAPLYEKIKIVPDNKTGHHPFPGDSELGQQLVLGGHWIHWIQEGWQPEDWARLFIRDGQPK